MNKDFSYLSITPRLIAEEFRARGAEFKILNYGSSYALFRYKDSVGIERLARNVITDTTSSLAARISDNKYDTEIIADSIQIPHPKTQIFTTLEEAISFLGECGQLVVKPVDSSHGNGVSVGITTATELTKAVEAAQTYSKVILLQEQIDSAEDVRLLFIDGIFRAATKRIPAYVTGDDVHTLQELIELENDPQNRTVQYSNKPCMIPLQPAINYLGERYATEIPEAGKEVQVVGTANIGTGGLAVGITEHIDNEIVALAQKLVSTLGMNVCGVDFLISKDGKPYFIEINASPSFGLHHYPHTGEAVDVASHFVDMIMKPRARIS